MLIIIKTMFECFLKNPGVCPPEATVAERRVQVPPDLLPGSRPAGGPMPDFFKGLSYSPVCAFPGLLLCPGLRSPQQPRGKSQLTACITFLCVPRSPRAGLACARATDQGLSGDGCGDCQ